MERGRGGARESPGETSSRTAAMCGLVIVAQSVPNTLQRNSLNWKILILIKISREERENRERNQGMETPLFPNISRYFWKFFYFLILNFIEKMQNKTLKPTWK